MEWILIALATILTGLITLKLLQRKPRIQYEGDLFIYSDSEAAAEALAKLSHDWKFRPHIFSLGEMSIIELKKQSVAVFLCSSDTLSVSEFLRSTKMNAKQSLPNLSYAVIGLRPDSQAFSLEEALSKLKGRQVVAPSVLEEQVLLKQWADKFFTSLKDLPPPKPSKFLQVINYVPSDRPRPSFAASATQLLSAHEFRIKKIRDLKKDPEDCAMHIELQTDLPYTSAGRLAIFPQNDEETVRSLAGIQEYHLEDTIVFCSDKARPEPFPTPTTLLNAFLHHCDLTSLIRKKALKDLSEFATDPAEQHRLEVLASLKGKEEFRSSIQEPMLTVLDILTLFPSVKVPAGVLVQILDPMQPRFYSISSSPLAQPDSIHLTVQLTKDKTCEGKTKMGLCSGYFHKMFISGLYTPVRGLIQDGDFHLTPDTHTLYMVAIGSAIAPFRAIIQDIQLTRPIEAYLIYGCKNRSSRFVYKKEIENAIFPSEEEPEEYEYRPENYGDGPYALRKVFCAFSNEGQSSSHVQDIMLTHQETLWKAFEAGARLFICGSNEMSKSVLSLVETIAAEHVDDPKVFLASMIKSQRIVMEMWG